MLIRSVKLRNFKKHQSLDLDFHEKLNLIGGPNEVGKSTVAEAIHAVLFFKHGGSTKEQKELQSITSTDGPSVELIFQIGECVYTLKKTYLRNQACTLSAPGQPTLTGTAAEEALAKLLATQAPLGSPSQAKGEWAHLWVWQGSAGNNPVSALVSQQAKMFAQLQELGVMAAMASTKDQKVVETFSSRLNQIFTSTGKSKVGSNLSKAESSSTEAEENYKSISQEISSLEDQLKAYSEKQQGLVNAEKRLTELEEERKSIQKELNEIQVLDERVKKEKTLLENYQTKENELKAKIDAIKALTLEIQHTEIELKPMMDSIKALDQQIQELQTTIGQEEGLLVEFRKEDVALKEELDFCELENRILAKRKEIRMITENLAKVKGIQASLYAYREKLVELPPIEQKDLDTWTTLESHVQTAEGVLNAIATEVEILNSQEQLGLNGEQVQGKKLLTQSAIFQLNGKDLLKITPGGGESLESATQKHQATLASLQEFKNRLGLQKKSQALEIVQKRRELSGQISNESAKLGALDRQEQLQQVKVKSEAELSQLDLQKNTLVEQSPHLNNLHEIDFENHGKEIQKKRNALLVKIQEKSSATDALKKRVNEVKAEQNKIHEKSLSMTETLAEKKPRLNLLLEQGGEELDAFETVQESRKVQESVYQRIKLELEDMMPEHINTSDKQNQVALKTLSDQYRQLELDLATLKGKLNQTGERNPYLEQQTAFTRLELLRNQLQGLRQEGEAIKLLNQLFVEEQQQLTQSYAAPFAEKVQHYLSFIFGRNVSVNIQSDQSGTFSKLEIYRDQFRDLGTVDFDKLSGGTKEQMAAAVRLAMAEVLAPAYGGYLPMIFDDAFAYSDKERLKALPDMLFSAAERGLQIILLSCTPQEYGNLGAFEVSLN
ncbi:AAA family ATPase [Mongoliitalea lutea]|uniref:ATPase n=1 Tax=Mongoliitalea lutea TaxID=849756 RepID=A0A8J3CZH0_9BACT|nr:AAA family ATPase [Mongoliitalea lutea]GHB49191.1 ATPase [Mongoliitalea lutea]